MGYYMAMYANKIDELEDQETLTPEQVEALQLTEEEVAELNVE